MSSTSLSSSSPLLLGSRRREKSVKKLVNFSRILGPLEDHDWSFFIFAHFLEHMQKVVFSEKAPKKFTTWVLKASLVRSGHLSRGLRDSRDLKGAVGRSKLQVLHGVKIKTKKNKKKTRKILGAGAYGQVFHKGSNVKKFYIPQYAADGSLDLKNLKADAETFLREFLIGVVTYGSPGTFYRLAIGYVAGVYSARMTLPYLGPESVSDYALKLRKEGMCLSLALNLRCFAEACGQVFALHEKGVAHLDIKPANMVLNEGRLSIADFGSALFMEEMRDSPACQKVKRTAPGFKGLEAFNDEENQYHDFLTDVYSLAAMFLYLEGFSLARLTSIFDDKALSLDDKKKQAQILLDDFLNRDKFLIEYSRELKNQLVVIFRKMMDFDPKDRLSSRFLLEISNYFLALSAGFLLPLSPELEEALKSKSSATAFCFGSGVGAGGAAGAALGGEDPLVS